LSAADLAPNAITVVWELTAFILAVLGCSRVELERLVQHY